MKGKTTFRLAKAYLTLFAVLFSFTGAWAQIALPYEYGFETPLADEGWTIVDGAAGTGISTIAKRSGDASFVFSYNTNPPQYLISPELDGTSALKVSLYYASRSTTYPELFQVGYSTTTADTDAFTWDEEVKVTNVYSQAWLEYTNTYPAGTKYIAIRYNSNDQWMLFFDDISITAFDGLVKPSGVKVSYEGGTQAIVSWSSDDELFDIDLNGTIIEGVGNPYTLTDLAWETEYTVAVRVNDGSKVSDWSAPVTFTTAVQFPAVTALTVGNIKANAAEISWNGDANSYNVRYRIPAEDIVVFEEGFENGLDAQGWTTVRGGAGTEATDWTVVNGETVFQEALSNHSGSYSIMSRSWASDAYAVDNWLISPKVTLGRTLQYWVMDDGKYHEHYDIYVSTTGNDINDFTLLYEPGNATGSWQKVTIDLSSFEGQEGYIAFRHADEDQDFLFIDDIVISRAGTPNPWETVSTTDNSVELTGLDPETEYEVEVQAVYADGESVWTATSFTTIEDVPTPSGLEVSDITYNTAVLSWTENGEATEWQIILNQDIVTADSNPFTLTGLTPETTYTAYVVAVDGQKTSKFSEPIVFTTDIQFHAPSDVAASDITPTSATISWTVDEIAATATSYEVRYANAENAENIITEYKYDDGNPVSTIAAGGAAFSYAVMFPAGEYSGRVLSSVSVFDYQNSEETITIYNGGATAPENAIASKTVTFTQTVDFVEVDFDELPIDDSKNLWVVVSNNAGSGVVYAQDNLGDPNARWTYLNNRWGDLATMGVPGAVWMIHVGIGDADTSNLEWTTIANATSPTELTNLDSDSYYVAQVKAVYADGESLYATTSFKTLSTNPVPESIAADIAADGATITWEGKGESYKLRYRTAGASGEAIFEENFESLDNWTVYTEGEGTGWTITENGATAYSYDNDTNTSWDADNWLVSPAVELGGILKFTPLTATSYPDSYEVLLSTTGNQIADFTTTLKSLATAENATITIDLTAYAGQTGYIAIRHKSYDCFIIAISDFALYKYVPASDWTEIAVADTKATISGLATNNTYEYQVLSVKGDNESDWSEAGEFSLITLENDGDNDNLIDNFNGKQAHVTIAGRTFYKDGNWNTFYLPFDLTEAQAAASPLNGGDIRAFLSSSVDGESAVLTFTEEGQALTAFGTNSYMGGVPYIIKWTSGSDIVNPEFANVTITSARYYTGDQQGNVQVRFEGTYATESFNQDDTSILFIGEGNKLNYPQAGARIKATHAYFTLSGITAGEASGVKFFTNLDDDDATGIAEINGASGTDNWYDLSGRKLASKPAVKGIYVTDGRKVTVK